MRDWPERAYARAGRVAGSVLSGADPAALLVWQSSPGDGGAVTRSFSAAVKSRTLLRNQPSADGRFCSLPVCCARCRQADQASLPAGLRYIAPALHPPFGSLRRTNRTNADWANVARMGQTSRALRRRMWRSVATSETCSLGAVPALSHFRPAWPNDAHLLQPLSRL
jgi:hypothetical protein